VEERLSAASDPNLARASAPEVDAFEPQKHQASADCAPTHRRPPLSCELIGPFIGVSHEQAGMES
jgi:hypothetical protein